MIYPIVAYGDPVLKKVAKDFDKNEDTDIKKLVEDMFETMAEANGVGLAGPQVGLNKRIFVIDSSLMLEEEDEETGIRQAFINAEIIEEDGEDWTFEEGCLSIPGIRGEVERPEKVLIKYYDEDWNEYTKEFEGMTARVIQHEYDHIEGILFTDYLSPIKKRLLKGKLDKISKGQVRHDYKMKFPKK